MRKPEIENFVWAALAWFWFAQFPFMVLIGNDWLFANLPFNWAVLLGLYSIALPFFVAGAVYLFAKRRFDRLSKEPANV